MLRKQIFIIGILIFAGCSRSNDSLIKDLSSNRSSTRRSAASQLMLRQGDRELVEKLIKLLDGEDERVTFIAAQILGSLSDSLAVKPLGKLLDHPNINIRETACWSLGGIGHDSALPYIVKGLNDPVSDVRYAAVVAVGHLHYLPALKYLYPMFRDDADSVRVRAIQSLYYYRAVEGSKILGADFATVVNDRSELVRYVAVQALGGAWEDVRGWVFADSTVAGELLIEALKDKSKFVRIEAIKSLKKLRYKKAVPIMKKMYDIASVDEEVEITEAVKEIANEDFPP